MIAAICTSKTVEARLAARVKPRPTHLIIVDGTVLETEVGFAWSDMLDFIWSGDGPEPATSAGWTVQEAVFEEGRVTNITDHVARHLCRRTHERRETPAHLRGWLEWCGQVPFDDGADDTAWTARGGMAARFRQAAE